MKTLKLVIFTLFIFATSLCYSKNVKNCGVTNLEKDKSISMAENDVTSTLSSEQQTTIKNNLDQEILTDKKIKEAEKAKKKAEKARKKAEKKQKAAEKQLKKAEKAKKNYFDTQKKYERELKKHQKLQSKGKLSPENEIKWQKKLDGLKNKIEKFRKKL